MSFIIVKYGANEERYANPNTLSCVLLSHLKQTCGFSTLPDAIDLASETGEVVDLVSKPKEYAKKYLEGRGVYILVRVVGDDGDDSTPTYTSLLEQSGGEKLKFSVSKSSRRKDPTKTRSDAPTRRGNDPDDTDNARGGTSTSTGATGLAAKRGAGGNKGAKASSSGYSSTTSLYEAANTGGARIRGAGAKGGTTAGGEKVVGTSAGKGKKK